MCKFVVIKNIYSVILLALSKYFNKYFQSSSM